MTGGLGELRARRGMVEHVVDCGGRTKDEVAALLAEAGICLNAYATTLFASELFTTAQAPSRIRVLELSVGDLGLSRGGTMEELFRRAADLGLGPCPLETGPYLRLRTLDQEEVTETERHKAPKGSVTVLSEPLRPDDDDFPKGFYLRRIEGRLWLRAYICPMDYVWEPETRIALRLA